MSLYNIYPAAGFTARGANSAPDLADRGTLADVFESIAMTGSAGFDAENEGAALHVDAQSITPSFFEVLRVRALFGRSFTDEHAIFGKSQFAILSHSLWKDLFAQDPNVIGKDIRLSGQPYRIVGVMPEGFESPGSEARLWVPLAFSPQQLSEVNRHSNQWGMIARLKPRVSIAYAQQRIDALNKQLEDKVSTLRKLIIDTKFRTVVEGMKDEMVQDIRPTIYLLQGAVTFVLLIGCVNVANLLLVKSNVRMREMAIRFSLGAGQWRLGRQLLVESVTLSCLGGLLGVLTGWGGVQLLAYLGRRISRAARTFRWTCECSLSARLFRLSLGYSSAAFRFIICLAAISTRLFVRPSAQAQVNAGQSGHGRRSSCFRCLWLLYC